jgi:hypothetical protein
MMGSVVVGELKGPNGSVEWDGSGMLRLRYDAPDAGPSKLSSALRTRLDERVVPVEALQAVEVSDDALRLVLRDGADPLLSVKGGYFEALIGPYSFPFRAEDRDLAQRLAADIRTTLTRRNVPATPSARWLVAPPIALDRIEGRDATLSVASGRLQFAYGRPAGRRKRAESDTWSVPLVDIIDVEWSPNQRRLGSSGFLRISTARTPHEHPKPKHDPAAMVTRRRTDVDALFFAARLLTRIRP